jgi:hypothetical protein
MLVGNVHQSLKYSTAIGYKSCVSHVGLQIVGFANYIRRYVKGFSDIVRPLTKLTKKGVKFFWGDRQQEALMKVKKVITSNPTQRNHTS